MMETIINACITYPFPGDNCLETAGIWEEAGFIPPRVYMHLTEFLHITFLNESRTPEYILTYISGNKIKLEWRSAGKFQIYDREKMFGYAKNMGIVISKKDENQIAAEITAGVIAEYISSQDNFFDMTKTIIPLKNEILKEYSSLKA